jgi:drug/metabolite transporter (DMT)-like permease
MSAAAPAAGARPLAWQIGAALFAVYVIWGSTYLVMRVALHELPPMLMGSIRFAIAGTVLLAIGRLRGEPWPTRRQWARAAPIGVLLFAGGNGLVAVGELEVSSGLAAVVVATMPLWMALLGVLLGERPSGREWLGLGLGMFGVVVLMSGAELSAAPVAAVALGCSPIAWAIGSMLSRRLDVPRGLIGSASFQLMGSLAMLAVGLVRGERLPGAVSAETVGAMAYLIVLGSVIGFTAYTWLLVRTRPALATSYAFVNPPLAVLLGAMLGAEAVGRATLLATPLVVAAVLLVVTGQQRAKAT